MTINNSLNNYTTSLEVNGNYSVPTVDGTINQIMSTDGVGTLSWVDSGSLLTDLDNILYVGKHGNDANNGMTPNNAKLTIQAAVTAAVAGDTILVYPGTYTETITHAANNVTLIGEGHYGSCIITQADANVIDFSTYTDIEYRNFKIECSGGTTAIWTVEGTTGEIEFIDCDLVMNSSAAIVAVAQPGVARTTGAGILKITRGRVFYDHTGACGGTAIKSAITASNGSLFQLTEVKSITLVGGGSSLVFTPCFDNGSSGLFEVLNCRLSVEDTVSTISSGSFYLTGNSGVFAHELFKNTVFVKTGTNAGYGLFTTTSLSQTKTSYNHYVIQSVGGTSYSFNVGDTSIVESQFDDITAPDGSIVLGTGVLTLVSSEDIGSLTTEECKSLLFDTNVAAAALNIYDTNIDAVGSDANIDITLTPQGTGTVDATSLTVNSAFTFPTVDGTANQVMKTDGAGALTWATDPAGIGILVQEVHTNTSSKITCTTVIPTDDTIPQNTEGDQVLTLSITPESATNILEISFNTWALSSTLVVCSSALFQDSTVNALSSTAQSISDTFANAHTFNHFMTAGTTSSTTFKIRTGPAGTASIYINGNAAGRIFGGVSSTTLSIREYEV